MGGALLGIAGMSDDNIIHFNPWRDFNDAAPLDDPFAMSRIDTATLRQGEAIVRHWFKNNGGARTCAPSGLWSPSRTPTRSSARTMQSPGWD
jgi:hypothetical protein